MAEFKELKYQIRDIKSSYIIKGIFLFLDEKQKLNLIIYNKKMQNKMDIKLINYKFYSGKYIIYETNIKGKEYNGDNDYLEFEGEYLNGIRHGKGKDYHDFNGPLYFEGEYLNGKRMAKEKNMNIMVN